MTDLTETTRGYYRAVDAGDVEAVLAWFAEDGVYHRPGYAPMRGRAALAAFYGGERVIASGAHRVDQVVVQGSSAAVRGVFTGTLKDGSAVSIGFADFIDYDQAGRARERHSFFDVPAV